jgi:hypothetical protein
MAIIQISRIIQRSGDLVDLPQLAEAELGWANDARRLFIGSTTPDENVEVLTSYSDISFGQIEGSYGNLDFSTPVEGQLITYNKISNTWVNTGGNALNPGNTSEYRNNKVHLGDVGNVKLGGGSLGYVLETDGQGNLSWSTKGTLRNQILNLYSDEVPLIIKIDPNAPYVNGLKITISGANATNANTILNGQDFYVDVANDFPVSGNVSLFYDPSRQVAVNGNTLGTYIPNSGIAVSLLSSASDVSSIAQGIEGSIQFNQSGFSNGSAQLTWINSLLNVSGNANVSGTINAGALSTAATVTGSQIVSTTISQAPLVVSSSIRIPNANVQTAGNLINGNSNIIVNTSGNIIVGITGTASVATFTSTGINITANANIGNIGTAGIITATGNIQGGNLRTTGLLSVSGNANVGNLGATNGVFVNVSGNGALLTNLPAGNINGQVASALIAGTVYTNAQPNITSLGTLTGLNVSGIVTSGIFTANGVAGRVITQTDSGGSISLGLVNGTASSSPYIDFNTSRNAVDYDVRLMASGNLGVVGSGQLTITAAALSATGNISIGGSASVTGNISSGNIQASQGTFTTVNASTIGGANAAIVGNGIGLTSIPTANLNNPVSLTSQVSGILPISSGGTGQSTRAAAINALLPSQSGNAGAVLVSNGTNVNWGASATEAWVKNLINTIEPLGTIKAWAGTMGNIPSGWALCNGQNGTLNLTDRFIAAFGGGIYGQNGTGGWWAGQGSTPVSGSTFTAGTHAHGFSTQGAWLSIDQIPGHAHTFRNIRYSEAFTGAIYEWIDPVYGYQFLQGPGSSRGMDYDNGVFFIDSGTRWTGGQNSGPAQGNENAGANPHFHGIISDGAHSHGLSASATVPGFFALAFIQKIALLT